MLEALRNSRQVRRLKALQLPRCQAVEDSDRTCLFLCFDRGNSQYAIPVSDLNYHESSMANYLRLSRNIFSSLQWWERWLPFYGILDVQIVRVSTMIPFSLVDANDYEVRVCHIQQISKAFYSLYLQTFQSQQKFRSFSKIFKKPELNCLEGRPEL